MKEIFWKVMVLAFVYSPDVPDELGDLEFCTKSPEIKAIKGVLLTFWMVVIIVVAVSFAYFLSKSTVFIVSASVEKILISPFWGQKYPVWKLNNAKLHSDCGERSSVVSGHLYPAPSVYIEFLRVQKGELIISLDNDESDSVGEFVTESNVTIKLDDCASIRLSATDDVSFIFPIEGQIKLGGDIKVGSDSVPILYNGEVTIVDKAFFTSGYYSIGPFKLKMGDIFVVDDLVVKSSGFVQVDATRGIRVAYSSKGRTGYIKKYKTEKIEIQNGYWSKIYNDPSLILLWFIGLGLYTVSKNVIRVKLKGISY